MVKLTFQVMMGGVIQFTKHLTYTQTVEHTDKLATHFKYNNDL